MRRDGGIETVRSARDDNAAVRSLPFLTSVLDLVTDIAFVVNPERRVVYVNEACSDRFEAPSNGAIGLAPGELMRCASAGDDPASCASGVACTTCGLESIIRRAAEAGTARDSSSVRLAHGHVMDLEIEATAIHTEDGRRHVLCLARDRSREHWQRQLDRSFFHDALDLSAGILGLAELATAGAGSDEDHEALAQLALELVEMIRDQRMLKAAEADDLTIEIEPVDLRSVANAAIDVNRRLARDRSVLVEGTVVEDLSLVIDGQVLTRVLSNLIRNAIEAGEPGDVVSVDSRRVGDDRVEISVHNPREIAPEVRSGIFRRPASTKGAQRGLGTFSARLLTERYLHGTIHFVTGPELGTTFYVLLPLDRHEIPGEGHTTG